MVLIYLGHGLHRISARGMDCNYSSSMVLILFRRTTAVTGQEVLRGYIAGPLIRNTEYVIKKFESQYF